MALNDVYQVVIDINVENQRTTQTLYFLETTGSTDPVPAKSLVNAIADSILPLWIALMSSQGVITSIYARRIFPTPAVPGQKLVPTADGQGDRSANCCPPQAATVVTLYTTVATRRGRGRLFIGALAEEDQDTGQLTTTHIGRVEDLLDALMTGVPAAGAETGEWELAVWSELDAAARDVIHYVVRTNVGSIRSRRAIYGPGGAGT